jgi:phosphate transport system substrate-binding protein
MRGGIKGETMKKILLAGALLTAGAAVIAQSANSITGSGASAPFPLYTEMFNTYATQTGVKVNYASKGSGGGRADIIARNVDFAGSDAFMTDTELKSAPGAIIHVPMALVAVVPTYNIPGVTTQLKFTGQVLADIYLGDIKKWNDPAIAALNKTVKLPDLAIAPVYRSDSSGTTAIFVDFLAKASSEWANKVSKGPQGSVKWPVGTGGPQNAGVVGLVRQTPGGIGYAEVTYAKANKLQYGLIRNATGKFVDGGDLGQIAAASDAQSLPDDTRTSITNASIGYPISGFTWILVYKDQKYGSRTKDQAKALVSLLRWMLADGQKLNNKLDYGQIDGSALKKAQKNVESMNYGGEKL